MCDGARITEMSSTACVQMESVFCWPQDIDAKNVSRKAVGCPLKVCLCPCGSAPHTNNSRLRPFLIWAMHGILDSVLQDVATLMDTL